MLEEALQGEYVVSQILWDGREWLLLAKNARTFGNGAILKSGGRGLSKVGLPFSVAHIASNGSAWLLIEARKGEPYNLWLYEDGDLSKVKVPYERFAAEQPPLKLFIDKVEWRSGAWLVCASYGDVRRTLRFDEESIAEVEEECGGMEAKEAMAKSLLPANEELLAFGMEDGEWLFAGKPIGGAVTFYKHRDGKLETLPSPPVELLRVDTIAYGDGYWLIGATSRPGAPPPPPGTSKEKIKTPTPAPMPVLLKFEGNAWEEIPYPGKASPPAPSMSCRRGTASTGL
jgi:hypothetical protein